MNTVFDREIESGHQKLEVWKIGIDLVKQIYLLTREFPKEELYGLTSQLRRSAVSVPSNIAEGNARRSQKEFQHYLFITLGSLAELETQLVIAFELGYISDQQCHSDLRNLVNKIRAMTINLLRKVPHRDTWYVSRGA